MDRNRASEIIAAYGADPARWPNEERASLRAAIEADALLRRAVEDAATLDGMIMDWVRTAPPAGRAMDTDALADRLSVPRRRWLPAAVLVGSVAAGFAAMALLVQPSPPLVPATTEPGDARLHDSQMWTMVFTPTPEEEALI